MAVPNAEVSFWNHRQHSLHMERLSQIKPTMNIKDESHVRSIDQRKKELIRQQREAKIEQDNKKLVVNMMQIVAKMGKESAQAAAPFKVQSRAEAQRRRQAQEIARQNYVCSEFNYSFSSCVCVSLLIRIRFYCFLPYCGQTLAMRIINQKPSFDQKKLESDFKKHEQIVRLLLLRDFIGSRAPCPFLTCRARVIPPTLCLTPFPGQVPHVAHEESARSHGEWPVRFSRSAPAAEPLGLERFDSVWRRCSFAVALVKFAWHGVSGSILLHPLETGVDRPFASSPVRSK